MSHGLTEVDYPSEVIDFPSGYLRPNGITSILSSVHTPAGNKFNIPDSTDQQPEATILALTPTNPVGEVKVKFGSDTFDLYVWDGSAWYIYYND